MADPRFYDNRGPFSLADICEAAGAVMPQNADCNARIDDTSRV